MENIMPLIKHEEASLLASEDSKVALEPINTIEITGHNMTLEYNYPETTLEAVLVPNQQTENTITLEEVIAKNNLFPINVSLASVQEYETQDNDSTKLVARTPFYYPSTVANSTLQELSLQEHAEKVLTKFVKTVSPYSTNDWILAYGKIDFNLGKSKPDTVIRNICISNEILEIANKYSWDFVYDMGDAYLYNGCFWVKLEEKQALHFMRDISIQMGIKKYEAKSSKFGEALYKEVVYSGALSRNTKPTDKLLLNMKNGTLHVDNDAISLKPYNKDDFLKYQLQFDYNPDTVNPLWLHFLDDILPDKDTQKTLQQSLGSLFLRGINLNKMVLLYGSGANGKSVIFDVINGLLGKELMANYSLNSLTDSKGYHRSKLKDKLVNFASDIDLSKIDIGIMKTLASGEAIECRLPYKEPFIMEDYAKCVFNLNDISTAKIENTEGFFRRFMFVPFNVTIPVVQQDKLLAKKLLQNKAGILNWILEGAMGVLESGHIFESQESQDFMSKFREQPTPVEKFLLDYQVRADFTNKVQSSILYEYYKNMCLQDNVNPVSNIIFSRQLEAKGYTKDRDQDGMMWDVSLISQ